MDTIQYTDNGDGTFTKAVTHTEIVTDVKNEIDAINAQLTDFKKDNSNKEISDAIENHQQAITTLENLQSALTK